MDKLIDVSVWQGLIDWKLVHDAGINHAYIKCGGSDTGINYQDRNFVRNWQQSKSNGVSRGMYYFASANMSIEKQSDAMAEFFKTYGDSEYKFAIDLEDKSFGVGCENYIIGLINAFEAKTQSEVVIYTANWWFADKLKNIVNKDFFAKRPLWFASYTANPIIPSAWTDYAIWQYSSSGRINGITENVVDLNWIKSMQDILVSQSVKEYDMTSYVKAKVVVSPSGYVNVRNSPNIISSNIVRKAYNGDIVRVIGNKTATGFYQVECNLVLTDAELSAPLGSPTGKLFIHSSLLSFETLSNNNSHDYQTSGMIKYGMHDIPNQQIFKNDKRGCVLITLEMNQQPPINEIKALFDRGVQVVVRASWNYSAPAVPKTPDEILQMANWYRGVFSQIGQYVYAAQILNEPNLEITPHNPSKFTPEYVANVWNVVAKEIKSIAPNVKLSPPPLAWLSGVIDLTRFKSFVIQPQIGNSMYNALKYGTMHSAMSLMVNQTESAIGWVSGLETPLQYATRMWGAMNPKPDFMIAHTYDHGLNADPNQKFTDAPMTDVYFNIRNIENQLTAWQSVFGYKPKFGVGETNPCADARSPQDMRTDWFDRTWSYLDRIGAEFCCYFRWTNSPAYGVDYGLNGRNNLISSFIDSQK